MDHTKIIELSGEATNFLSEKLKKYDDINEFVVISMILSCALENLTMAKTSCFLEKKDKKAGVQ